MKKIRSIEGLRRADLGNGTYKNPIVPGDHPDPSILKDGNDYYMTFSSFLSYPGIVIWHSKDLINWSPLCTALKKPIGSVWAVDLVKYNGRYFIYIPAVREDGLFLYVIHADNIRGPWSDPVDMKMASCIDPGHVVGEDGKRYLFVNGIRRIALSDDGLSTIGQPEHAYDPWQYPDHYVVEMFAAEGPKFVRKGGFFYLVSAVGGTAGPPTSHMVIVARSGSIKGPWEHCPHNPIIHTQSESEPWWSRGHASVIEGPSGDWWIVYHGYENGFRTLGRQTLLEPIEWTKDGWFRAKGGDLSRAMKKPHASASASASALTPARYSLSDDFSTDKLGIQWSFYNPSGDENDRIEYADGSLTLRGRGDSPADCTPLPLITADCSYEASVSVEPIEDAQGGLLLYYSEKMFCGIGFNRKTMFTYNYGQEHSWMRTNLELQKATIRLLNINNVVTWFYSVNDNNRIKHPWQMEVSGMHHNVFGGFTSLKLGLFSTGKGLVRFRSFTYKHIIS